MFKLAVRGFLVGAILWSNASLAQETKDVLPPVLESQPKTESGNDTSKEQREERRQEEKPRAEKLTPALEKIESAIRDFIAQQNATQSQPPEDHEISDLKAQERMAFWAKLMFWTSAAMVVITGVGIHLIRRTLGETKRAADYTEGMLGEARKTTTAAERAVDVTRDSAERQLRAYVTVTASEIRGFGQSTPLEAWLEITNQGQTPAQKIRRTAISVVTDDIEGEFPLGESTHESVLGPGGKADLGPIDINMTGDSEGANKVLRGEGTLLIFGKIFYEDIFGESQETGFRYYVQPNSGPSENTRALSHAGIGNYAT